MPAAIRRSSIRSIRRHPKIAAVALIVPLIVINAMVGGPAAVLPSGPADFTTVDRYVSDQVRDAGIPGAAVVIVRDGRIVHEQGFGSADGAGRPVTPTTPFMIGSMTKSITALAVMQLVDTGRIELDAPVRMYLPGFRVADPDAAGQITVRQLLTHTSGIPGSAGVAPLAEPPTTLAARVDDLARVTLASAPGSRYAYSNANYLVLGRLVEVVSGQPFGDDLADHVFGPLAMTHATTDRAVADASGLTRAHRIWFGLADERTPIDRPDLVPAGFVAASADDLGHFLIAQLEDGRYDGRQIVSAAAVRTMHTGTASTGLPGEQVAMGWMTGSLDGEPIVSHAGSTTDMAAIQVLVPGRHLGVAILLNAQSTLYELLHKPDFIGLGVTSLLIGREPAGTLQAFYPAFDGIVLMLFAVLLLGLVRQVRARPTDPSVTWTERSKTARARLVGGHAWRLYLDVLVPLVILLRAPDFFGAPWLVLVRVDIGLVLFVFVLLRLADGAIRLGRFGRGRWSARSATARPSTIGAAAER